jgi:hypothetical protein
LGIYVVRVTYDTAEWYFCDNGAETLQNFLNSQTAKGRKKRK